MKTHLINFVIVSFFVIFPSISFSQQKSKCPISLYNKYPWQGRGGLKFNTGTRFNKQFFGEIGYMKTDIPREKDLKEDQWTLGNQNIYTSLEFSKIGNDVFLAPKIGYEYSLLIFSGRISWVNYYNLSNKERDSRIVLEPGVTLFGIGGLYYGFSLPVGGKRNVKIGNNSLTLTINYLQLFR